MRRLDSYVGKTVLSATLLVWTVITVLDAILTVLGELGDVGRGNYALADAVLFTLLTLPGAAWQLFPMAVLVGCLLGLGGLAVQLELTAFRLSGCSPARLTGAVLWAGAVLLVLAAVVGEVLAPPLRQQAIQVRATALYGDIGVQRGAGFWVRDGMRLIQVGNAEADGGLARLVVFEMDATPRLATATAVTRARYENGQWLLQGVRTTTFTDQRVDVSASPQTRPDRLIDPGLAELLSRDGGALNLLELGQYIDYLQRNGSNVAPWRMKYWQRGSAPLAAFAMLLLSVSLVLGPLGRQNAGKRVLTGVVLGLGFKLLNDITAYAGLVYGVAPWLSALLPSLLMLVTGLLLLRRSA